MLNMNWYKKLIIFNENIKIEINLKSYLQRMMINMHTTHKKLLEESILGKEHVVRMRASSSKKVSSSILFGGAKDIVIAHFGELYRLTITKQKKLLLTKVKSEDE